MTSWDPVTNPDEAEVWDEFVRGVRKHTIGAISESAFVMSIVPSEEPDLKFCVELGLSIMLDKPLLVVIHPDTPLPARLLRVADAICECDIDTEGGREALAAAIKAMQGE